MRPKQLKFPFRWEERAPILLEKVLYVPKHYQEHDQWNKQALWDVFSSFDSICIEYCAGNGAWIEQKAKDNSQVLWVAVEKRFDRVQKIWAKQQNYSLNNLLVVCGDALTFTKHYIKDSTVEAVFVNFPDPWPKEKHAKNRLIQREFVEEIRRIVKRGGEATFVSDDEAYSHQMIEEMTAENGKFWQAVFPAPFYVTQWPSQKPSYGSVSFFEELWRSQGKNIHYMQFVR